MTVVGSVGDLLPQPPMTANRLTTTITATAALTRIAHLSLRPSNADASVQRERENDAQRGSVPFQGDTRGEVRDRIGTGTAFESIGTLM